MAAGTTKYIDLYKRLLKETLKTEQPTTNIKREILNMVNLQLPVLADTLLKDPAIREKYIVKNKPITFTNKLSLLTDISDYKNFEDYLFETEYKAIGKMDERDLDYAASSSYFTYSIFYCFKADYIKLHIGSNINETGLSFKINYLRKTAKLTGGDNDLIDLPDEYVEKLFEILSAQLQGEDKKEE